MSKNNKKINNSNFKSKNAEKITDCQMLNKFKEVFGDFYNTLGNPKLFGSKIPDGWFEFEDKLRI